MIKLFRILYRAPYGDTYTHADAGSLEKTVQQIIGLGHEITGIRIISASEIDKGV